MKHAYAENKISENFAYLKLKFECPVFSLAKSGTSIAEWKHAGKFQAAQGSKLCSQRSCHGSLSTHTFLGPWGASSWLKVARSPSLLHSRLSRSPGFLATLSSHISCCS